ncbi:MAG: RagB/SusD family nutrient uptake outer membrane protein [Prevotella sp.]|nr:RagB/SusD family nutrient uptake outer membrane protein [Prevotella sp.]
MKNFRKVAILTIIAPLTAALVGCDDAFEPAVENHKTMEQLEDMPQWAVGLLGHAYISNPLGQDAVGWTMTEVATDDAVSNDVDNTYRRMASGQWRADNNPMDTWQYLRASWQYINQMIELAPKVTWASDPTAAELYKQRFMGEAYGMRALYMYHLLRAHAGKTADGQLMGIPILTESETVTSEFNNPRNTFKECIDQLNADVEEAIKYLPEDYGNIDNSNDVPSKYRQLGATSEIFTRVFGDHAKNRMSARVAKAVRAQAALMAASPAYSDGSGVTWDQAANLLATVLKEGLGSNPLSNIDPTGNQWYNEYAALNSLAPGFNRPEILWRSNKGGEDPDNSSSWIETLNFPPSLFGNGRVNPSQNLVDAFPMANGLPITDPNSGYDPQNPYANRDPRLDLYIIHNGTTFKGQTINTAVDGSNDDALGRDDGRSTRTGYYLKKLLVEDVNCNPSNKAGQFHIRPWMRYTEFFLSYAEAANEAWGPTGAGSNGFSAYDVIKAIRQRAGINAMDSYLETCKADKNMMRELIRNERRIELCFEGFRFWDLRRWNVGVSKLNETVKGMRITNNHYEVFNVEDRKYSDYMIYGPIPYSEILKFDALIQNKGW